MRLKYIGLGHTVKRQFHEYADKIIANYYEWVRDNADTSILTSEIRALYGYASDLEHEVVRLREQNKVYLREIKSLNNSCQRKNYNKTMLVTRLMESNAVIETLTESLNKLKAKQTKEVKKKVVKKKATK